MLKNKLILISFIFVSIVCFFSTSSYADTDSDHFSFIYNDEEVVLRNIPDYNSETDIIMISYYQDSYNVMRLINAKQYMDNDDYTFVKGSWGSISTIGISYDNGTSTSYQHINSSIYRYIPSSDSWYTYQNNRPGVRGEFGTNDDLIYSPIEVKDGENFYFEKKNLLDLSQLAMIVRKVEMKPLAEIVGILPVVLITLIGLIGLRKALRMLSIQLRQS